MSRRARTCGACPKYDRRWCVLFAKRVSPLAKSCAVGRRVMDNILTRLRKIRMNERRKAK